MFGLCSSHDSDALLQIVAASALLKDQEVHNTYGEHGNAELVYKYGFALRHNPFDSVSLDKSEIMKAAKCRNSARAHKARASFLGEFRYMVPSADCCVGMQCH